MKNLNIVSILFFGIFVISCDNCQKLKSYVETDYVIIYNGSGHDTLGTLTLAQSTYSFNFNQHFPDSLKKYAPPFIFSKSQGRYRWNSEYENECIDHLRFDEMSSQDLEFDPARTKPENRMSLFTDNMNHRFGVILYTDSIISLQMGLNHTRWIIQSK